jgi:23S rRNA (guanosine2251-2'-O)-methyltransferase
MSIYIYGYHSIEELLKQGYLEGSLYCCSKQNKKWEKLIALADQKGIPVVQKEEKELSRLCGHSDHRGALLVLEELPHAYQDKLKILLKIIPADNALVLLLDNIVDPHNLGAILRSCDQFAVDLVVIPKRRSAGETQAVIKTSAGASSYVKLIAIANLRNAIDLLKKEGFWIYAADMQGKQIDKIDLKGRIAIVLGSEGQGIRHLLKEVSDGLIAIPAKGHVTSFNVSVAAGIILYEVRRQQGWFTEQRF